MMNDSNRRDFLKASGLLTGGAFLTSLPFGAQAGGYHHSVDDTIKIALIGCGGRGSGAAAQALNTKHNLKIVAMADAFRDRLDDAYKNLVGVRMLLKSLMCLKSVNLLALMLTNRQLPLPMW
jgi:hypothetical protein